MFFSVLCMATIDITGKKRTNVIETHDLFDRPNTPIHASVFWLTPQFILVGRVDVLTVIAVQELFYNEAPYRM